MREDVAAKAGRLLVGAAPPVAPSTREGRAAGIRPGARGHPHPLVAFTGVRPGLRRLQSDERPTA